MILKHMYIDGKPRCRVQTDMQKNVKLNSGVFSIDIIIAIWNYSTDTIA